MFALIGFTRGRGRSPSLILFSPPVCGGGAEVTVCPHLLMRVEAGADCFNKPILLPPESASTTNFISRLSLDSQKFAKVFLIKTDDDVFVAVFCNRNDRNAHLLSFVDHHLALFEIGADVVVGEGDVVCGKELLGHVAEVTGSG